MKKKIIRILAGVCMLGLIASYMMPQITAKATDVEPIGNLVDSYIAQNGQFSLEATSRFFIVAENAPSGELLQTVQLVQRQFSADGKPVAETLEIVWGPEDWAKAGDIVIKLDAKTSINIGNEGYNLKVTDKAVVTAKDANGLLYGLNMLHKCFKYDAQETKDNSYILNGFNMSDTPDTKERTVMLDVARKYYTKDWICNFIREMSWMGYNTIQLHFSEDGGFRADLWDPEYYRGDFNPKNDLSWLCGSHVQYWVHGDYKNDPDAGKYLSTKELVEIIETAKEYHIDIIPSFDSPAHMDYITWKFEQNYKKNPSYSFEYDGITYRASDVDGKIYYTHQKMNASAPSWQYSTMDPTNEVSKAFVLNIYSDIADFFSEYSFSENSKSKKFSIGADEIDLEDYEEYTITWEYEKFPIYINQLNRMLNEKGYTCRMFNDVIGCGQNGTASQPANSFDKNIEIMYWNSSYVASSGGDDGKGRWSAEDFWSIQGRTIYNCIQTNCYYVLRVVNAENGKDARDPDNDNWEFFGATEETIYNKWYPANPGEKGGVDQNVPDIDSDKLGGGYFLIWNDYAALNTEGEVWNGAKDINNPNVVYSLLNRMWSNIVKMWNSDVNDKVTYTNYASIRNMYGYFPGYGTCSTPTKLPSATNATQAYMVDHSAIEEALSNKKIKECYTSDSYATYAIAYAAAEEAHANHAATEAQLTEQINALKAAESDLVPIDDNLILICKTKVNNKEETIASRTYTIQNQAFSVYLKPINGYKYSSIEGARYELLPSKDGSGFVSGDMQQGNTAVEGKTVVTIWYENLPDRDHLDNILAEAPKLSEKDNYAAYTWTGYETALKAANELSDTGNMMQSDIDTIVNNLEKALSALTAPLGEGEVSKVVAVRPVSNVGRLGKQFGLVVTTTPDVTSLTVKDVNKDTSEELTLCTGRIQTLKNGEMVKIWLVNFNADEKGTFTYSVIGTTVAETTEGTVEDTITSEEIEITIK